MKRRILTFISLLALTVSCTPTSQQQVVLVTATPWIVTATSAPTDTPTPTTTPTATELPIATATVVPPTVAPTVKPKDVSPTPTVARTVKPPEPTVPPTAEKIVLYDPFDGSSGAFIKEHGTKAEFVPDPAGSPKQVMKITVTGPPEKLPGWGEQYWLTAWPTWRRGDGDKTYISAIEVEFYYPSDFFGDVGLLSAHGMNGGQEVTGILMAPSRSIICLTRDTGGKNEIFLKTKTKIDSNKWHTLRIEYKGDQTLFVIDGKVVHTADFKFQPIDAHAGFQWGGDAKVTETSPKLNSWILQRNFKVFAEK